MRPYVLECLSLASRLGHLVARHGRDYACTCTRCSPCRWYIVLLKLGFAFRVQEQKRGRWKIVAWQNSLTRPTLDRKDWISLDRANIT